MAKIRRIFVGRQMCDMCAAVIEGIPVAGHGFDGVAPEELGLDAATLTKVMSGDRLGVEFADGRVVCSRCLRDGLHDAAKVEAVRGEVLDVMRRFGMVLEKPAPIKVVDAAEMSRHTGLSWFPTRNHDARPMGAYGLARDGEQLLVESGQPRSVLIWTLAHETAHDWHAEQNPMFPLLKVEIQEGFAQWAADEVAERMGLKALAARQLNRRDVYGLAPRRFLRLEQLAGIDEVLVFARTIGAGRMMRLAERMMRKDQATVQRELEGHYGRWKRARDMSVDAELLARRGYVFASAVCLGLALWAMPLHPTLWGHWLVRRANNFWLSLTFRAGTARATVEAWSIVLMPLLTAVAIVWLIDRV